MNKKEQFVVFGLIFIILSFVNVSALTSNMKDEYGSRETVIVKIEGVVLEPITDKDVRLLRGHVEVPFKYGVKQINGDNFLWFITPEKVNNYTLIIKDVSSIVSGKNEKLDYMKNFSVGGNDTIYNVDPGWIFGNEDFELKVNSFEDVSFKIFVNFHIDGEWTISPGENIIKFSILDFQIFYHS